MNEKVVIDVFEEYVSRGLTHQLKQAIDFINQYPNSRLTQIKLSIEQTYAAVQRTIQSKERSFINATQAVSPSELIGPTSSPQGSPECTTPPPSNNGKAVLIPRQPTTPSVTTPPSPQVSSTTTKTTTNTTSSVVSNTSSNQTRSVDDSLPISDPFNFNYWENEIVKTKAFFNSKQSTNSNAAGKRKIDSAQLGTKQNPSKKRRTSRKSEAKSQDDTSEEEDLSDHATQKLNSKKISKQRMRDSYDKERTVSDSLAKLIGKRVTTRREATKLVWNYIRENNLQGANRNHVTFDNTLKKALNTEDNGITNAVALSSYVYRQFPKEDADQTKDEDDEDSSSSKSGSRSKLFKNTPQEIVTEGARKFFNATVITPEEARTKVREYIMTKNLVDEQDNNLAIVDKNLREALEISFGIDVITLVPGVAQYVRKVLSPIQKKGRKGKKTTPVVAPPPKPRLPPGGLSEGTFKDSNAFVPGAIVPVSQYIIDEVEQVEDLALQQERNLALMWQFQSQPDKPPE